MIPLATIAVAYLPLAVVSALVPWVNAELVLLSAVPFVDTPSGVGTLVLVMTVGQMAGKTVMFVVGRRAGAVRSGAGAALLGGWRTRLQRDPRSAAGVVLLSALVGFPPFYLVSIAAGALDVAFARFLVAGAVGRLVHFGALAFAPHFLWRAA
jgi:membrane protein YqaA with SNARE-associated domain